MMMTIMTLFREGEINIERERDRIRERKTKI